MKVLPSHRTTMDVNLLFSGLFLLVWGLRIWPYAMSQSVFGVISLLLLASGLFFLPWGQ